MLEPTRVRELLVDPMDHPRRQPHLSSASGLARAGRFLYVVADDEHHIGAIEADVASTAPLRLHRLRGGDLPAGKAQRKRVKPDLEALLVLPPRPAWPTGALLALGSGSTPAREQGWLLVLGPDGAPVSAPREIALGALYAPLRASSADLNIEGGFVQGERLHLLQRANTGSGRNACISWDLQAVGAWLEGGTNAPPQPMQVRLFELGAFGGVPYGWTDGAALPGGGWVFSAVAEDTSDSYADGPCAASAIGWVSSAGALQELLPLRGAPKVEGVALAADGGLLLVTDADDPARPSQLLRLDWPPTVPAQPGRA